MLLDDVTLEVRDRTLTRVGQVTKPFLSMKATVRWCGVGEWELTLPGDHAMVDHLVADGSGVILLGPDGESTGVIFSGPTTTPKRKRDAQNPDGTFTFTGVTDDVHLLDALAYPSPSVADPGVQTQANDTRTMNAESLLRAYVGANIADTSPAERRRGIRSKLWLEPVDQTRGMTITKSPRFQNLLELLREIVTLEPSIGFRVVQVDTALQFQVLDSRDKRAFVRFDVENGTLTSEEVQQSGPSLTYPIVAGQGEGTARTIIARTDAEAAAAEVAYGRVIESFIDQRDTDALVELQQSGDEALAEGRGGTSVKVIPADETTMQFGVDWRAGDQVTVVVNGVEAPTAVTETAILINADGVRAGAALGDVSSFTKGDALGAKVDALDVRVAQLERSATAGMLTGEIRMWPVATAPDGWLLCQGQVVSRTQYANLFDMIGTTFGAGDGSTTFALPDMRGRVTVGHDATQTEFDVLGERGGSKAHTLSTAELPSHTHGLRPTFAEAGGYGFTASNFFPNRGIITGAADASSDRTGAAGGGTAHNNLQPYIVTNYIIKT